MRILEHRIFCSAFEQMLLTEPIFLKKGARVLWAPFFFFFFSFLAGKFKTFKQPLT